MVLPGTKKRKSVNNTLQGATETTNAGGATERQPLRESQVINTDAPSSSQTDAIKANTRLIRCGSRVFPGRISRCVAHQLMNRSIHGSRTTLHIPKRYKPAVALQTSKRDIQALTWNHDGTLLAALAENLVQIYDIHLIQLAELKRETAQPILQFSVPKFANSIQWHSYRKDTLVVTVWNPGLLLIFDTRDVGTWYLSGCQGPTPCQKYKCSMSDSFSNTLVLKDSVLCTDKDVVSCYATKGGYSALWWQLRHHEPIRKMHALTDNFILLISDSERFIIVDRKRTERGVMGAKPRPVCLHSFEPLLLRLRPKMKPNTISYFKCETLFSSNDRKYFKITWVSAYGWVFSALLNLDDQAVFCDGEILRANDPMRKVKLAVRKIEKPDGSVVKAEEYVNIGNIEGRWCMPPKAVAADGFRGTVCFEAVQESVMCVGGHDKYMIGHEPELRVLSQKLKLLLYAPSNDGLEEVILGRKRGKPSCVALHPSNGMIVVGFLTSGIYAFTAMSS